DFHVTGVQTCALPICCYCRSGIGGFGLCGRSSAMRMDDDDNDDDTTTTAITTAGGTPARKKAKRKPPPPPEILESPEVAGGTVQIGRASCRERVYMTV